MVLLAKKYFYSQRYPTSGNMLYVNSKAVLEVREDMLLELESHHPELVSHTISLVGPCGAGKSSIIRALTPENCPKPTIASILQAVPTSGDVHVFDTSFMPKKATPMNSRRKAKDGGFYMRILDIEGFDGAKEKLPLDIERILQSEGRDAQERDKFALRRWERVQEFPRLCYALSDVVVYVETVPLARDLTTQLSKFAEKMKQGMGFVWPPDLIIVSNKVPYEEAQEDYRLRTQRWKNTHDKNNYFQHHFHSVICFALPNRTDPKSDKLWRDKMDELSLLIYKQLRKQTKLRKREKTVITRKKWCHLVRGM